MNVLSALNMLYEGLPGDPSDGVPDVTTIVELTDLILYYDYDESLTLPSSVQPEFDFNGDGNIDIMDLIILTQIVLNNTQTPLSTQRKIQSSLEKVRNHSRKELSTEERQLIQVHLNKLRKK